MHLNYKKNIKLINQKDDLIHSQPANFKQPITSQLISVHIMLTIKASHLPLELLSSPFSFLFSHTITNLKTEMEEAQWDESSSIQHEGQMDKLLQSFMKG